MLQHPFTTSINAKITGIVLILIAVVIQCLLLIHYTDTHYITAIIDSIIYISLLAVAGFMGWFTLKYIHVWQVHITLTLMVQLICLGISFSVLALTGLEDTTLFLKGLPLRVLFGLLYWIILMQWYKLLQYRMESVPETIEKDQETTDTTPEIERIDRISVKDGSRIHIIHIEELFCLQASGDYVTLFTPSGQYIKEQTMKYFETHLPQTFVRIHRSSIVNTEYIMRVELFGKETYQVKLKNGTILRASNTGYKALKERLSL